MTIEDLLRSDRPAILDEVSPAVAGLEHYRRDGVEATRHRLGALYDQLVAAVETRDLRELVDHAVRIARERFDEGFELAEVQSAVAQLELAIRRHAFAELPEREASWDVAVIGTALAHGKNAVGSTFAALSAEGAAREEVSLLARFRQRFSEELVYPV
jgi:hypothetical protein